MTDKIAHLTRLYSNDEHKWYSEAGEYIRSHHPELGAIGLADILESLMHRDQRELRSLITTVMTHLLVIKTLGTIDKTSAIVLARSRCLIDISLEDSAELQRKFGLYAVDATIFDHAREDAELVVDIKIPKVNPFTKEQILDPEYFGLDES